MNRNAQGMTEVAEAVVRSARVEAERLGFVGDDAKGVTVFGAALGFAMLAVMAGLDEAKMRKTIDWAIGRALGGARLFAAEARKGAGS